MKETSTLRRSGSIFESSCLAVNPESTVSEAISKSEIQQDHANPPPMKFC